MLELNPDRCFVIAEAGTAHLGYPANALRLVGAAKQTGADAVKFQWFTDEVDEQSMFCWIDDDDERAPRWRQSSLSLSMWADVKEFADKLDIMLLASTFERETVEWLSILGIEATKVASRAAKAFPYDVERLPKPFLVSTGMYGMGTCPGEDIYYLECEAQYPSTMAWPEDSVHGFSDHSGAPFLGIDAISRGCKLLEVHFMIDPVDAGPDLPACLTLDELKLVCEARDYYAERKAA